MEGKTVFGMTYLPEQIVRIVVSTSEQEPFRHCYWAGRRMAVCDQDRRTFPDLIILPFCQGDGHMVAGYKQIAMPQIFMIIPGKAGRKTNGNQACYLRLAEVAAAKLAYHFLHLICCYGHFPVFGASS